MSDRAAPDLSFFADTLKRIAGALERLAPRAPATPDFAAADAFIWHPEGRRLAPVPRVNRVDMSLLKGIDRVRDLLVENTERFARALPANNALLWGARGMGKSSLVKAVHAAIGAQHPPDKDGGLKLVEIHREDIESLPELMAILRNVCRAEYGRRATAAEGDAELIDSAVPLWQEPQQTADIEVLRRRDAESIRDLVSSLPERFREVLVLREIDDLSYRDIARIIEAPVGTVMSR